MDGIGVAMDNIWIEQFWKTIKYKDLSSMPQGQDLNSTKRCSQLIQSEKEHNKRSKTNRVSPRILKPILLLVDFSNINLDLGHSRPRITGVLRLI
jgi:hypothetical protein